MPKFPYLSVPAGAIPVSLFARLLEKMQAYEGDVFPLHLGDSYLNPPSAARMDRLLWDETSAGNLYRYASPAGDKVLIEAILTKLESKNGIEASPDQVQITAGATHGISCASKTLFNVGDEVLLLTPFWPMMRGHMLSAGAIPVEVPFSQVLYENPDADVWKILEEHLTPNTAAVYMTTPNNPDGKVLNRSQLEGIADFAQHHNLWVLADEVYEEFIYCGSRHVSIATFPGMAERTLTAFSFSKSYALPGMRVGYIVGPAKALAPLRRMSNHSVFSVPRANQRCALSALLEGEEFLSLARKDYAQTREQAVSKVHKMGLRCFEPEGGTYLFVDFSKYLRHGEKPVSLLERLAAQGVLLAPGYAFGRAYENWNRICFSAMPRDKVIAGIEKIGEILDV